MNWIALTKPEQLHELANASEQKKVLIFKHSARCGISSMVLKEFEKLHKTNETIDFYYLDLLTYRELSNQIALRFSVEHQSPQVILLKKNSVIASASHYDILELEL